MDKLTQEELNGLSPRARKQYEDSNEVLSEITTENPNKDLVVEESPDFGAIPASAKV